MAIDRMLGLDARAGFNDGQLIAGPHHAAERILA